MKFYLVQHAYENEDGSEEIKIIGVYSSRSLANAAVKRLRKQPGFSKYPAGFHVCEYAIDRDHWEEGFGFDDDDDHE